MKLHCLITAALVVVLGSALLAQNPLAPTKSAAPENAISDVALGEKLDVYVGQLKHGSVQERLEAVAAMGRIGERAKPAAPALAEALKSEDPVLRVAVAEALWQANKDPAAVAAFVAGLKDKNWIVVENAIEALSRIGPGAKAAVPALLKALDESWQWEAMRTDWATLPVSGPQPSGCRTCGIPPPPGLRTAEAAWLLWQIDRHPAAMPALIKSRGYGYLGLIGPEAKAAVPVIAELLNSDTAGSPVTRGSFPSWFEYGGTRIGVAIALWRINKHPDAVPTLIAGLKEKTPGLRVYAINALGGIGAEAKAAVPALAEALKDEKGFVGLAAAEALGNIGPEAKAAVPALLEALKDRGRMRVAAAEALWRINKHPAAVPALVEAFTDDADNYANWALCSIGVEAKAAAPALAEALKDKNVDRRVEVAVTLWKINQDPAVIPVLVEALKDMKANGYLRMYVAKALWRINKHPAAEPALIEVLKDKDANLRSYAAEALWQINRNPAAVPALVESLKGRDNWVGSAAARVLGRIGAEATVAEAALVEALQDEDEGVRTSAAQWLKKNDPAAAKKASVK